MLQCLLLLIFFDIFRSIDIRFNISLLFVVTTIYECFIICLMCVCMSVGYTPWEIAWGLIVFNKPIEEYNIYTLIIPTMRMRGRTSFIIMLLIYI